MQVEGECTKTFQSPDAKEAEQFGAKYGNGRINRKAKLITNMERELQELEELHKGKLLLHSRRATLEKVPIRKTPDHYDIHRYWF